MKKIIMSLLMATSLNSFAGDFLPVDKAFNFGYVKQDNKVQFFWNVADGYHLYKSKIRFEPSNAVKIDYWPEGKVMNDNAYGDQEMYYGNFALTGEIEEGQEITIFYQGCKLNELCYMPQRKVIK